MRGRTRACPRPPVGPRLDERGLLVPARDAHELDVLHDRAFALLHEGRATEWALAALAAGGQQRWGLYLSALEELVTELGRRIDAPYVVHAIERRAHPPGAARLECVDATGRVLAVRPADAVFDSAPVPAFVDEWRAHGAIPPVPERRDRDNVVPIRFERPSGPYAWKRWIDVANEERQ